MPNELYALDVRKTGREEEKQPQYSRPPSKWTLLQSPPSPVLVDRSSLGIRCMQEPLTSNSSLWGEQDFPMQVPWSGRLEETKGSGRQTQQGSPPAACVPQMRTPRLKGAACAQQGLSEVGLGRGAEPTRWGCGQNESRVLGVAFSAPRTGGRKQDVTHRVSLSNRTE